MATPKQSNFVRALRRLAESEGTLTPADINALSGATRNDLADFRSEWPRIAVERQRAIVTAMNEVAELSVHSDFTDLFLELLDAADEFVRAGAIDGLWENEVPSVAKRFVRMLMEDRSPIVRASAAEGLGHFLLRAEMGRMANPSSATMTEALLSRFNDLAEDFEVRRRALESVAYSSDERVHTAIGDAYEDDDREMRASAVFAMGRSADQSWDDIVVRELSSRDPAMRYEAATAAGELMIAEALPQLMDLVSDEDREVRESAVWALGQIGGSEARRVLEMVLEGDDESLHEAAEDALTELEFMAGETPFNMFDFDMPDIRNDDNGNGHLDQDEDE